MATRGNTETKRTAGRAAIVRALALGGFVAVLGAGTLSALDASASPATTERHVRGVITELQGGELTISPEGKDAVTGRVDARVTHITVNGRAASAHQLKLTFDARGEIGLDDVWRSVEAESR